MIHYKFSDKAVVTSFKLNELGCVTGMYLKIKSFSAYVRTISSKKQIFIFRKINFNFQMLIQIHINLQFHYLNYQLLQILFELFMAKIVNFY